jgi:hypothetical protein
MSSQRFVTKKSHPDAESQHSSRGRAGAMLERKLDRINNLRLIPRMDIVALVATKAYFTAILCQNAFFARPPADTPLLRAPPSCVPPILVPRTLSIRASALLLPVAPPSRGTTTAAGVSQTGRLLRESRLRQRMSLFGRIRHRTVLPSHAFSCLLSGPLTRRGAAESSARVGRRGSNRGPRWARRRRGINLGRGQESHRVTFADTKKDAAGSKTLGGVG